MQVLHTNTVYCNYLEDLIKSISRTLCKLATFGNSHEFLDIIIVFSICWPNVFYSLFVFVI